MKYIATILILLFILPVFGQRKKEETETVPTFVEGVIYALPQTGLRVWAVASEEAYVPGPFATYADELLGIPDAKTQAASNWVMNEVQLEVFSEPDPNKIFKAMGETASLISLSPSGCMAGINTSEVGLVEKGVVTNQLLSKRLESLKAKYTNYSETAFYMPGDSTNNFRPTRISMQQKAAEAAAKILECRKAMFEISAGLLDEFHPDGEAYKQSLEQLKKTEQEYLSLFVGKTSTHSSKFSFDIVPSNSSTKGEVIFRFSEQKGVVGKSDLSGKPVMMEIKKLDALTAAVNNKLASANPNAGESGVYYNMPGIADVIISYELNPIASSRITFAQFGSVAPVPENLLDGLHKLEFHPETGAIKNISIK